MAKDPSLEREEIKTLPRVSGTDVGNMLRNLYASSGQTKSYSASTEPDVWFEAPVSDFLNVSIGVPRAVNCGCRWCVVFITTPILYINLKSWGALHCAHVS